VAVDDGKEEMRKALLKMAEDGGADAEMNEEEEISAPI
jgi:hypothetical protein